LLRFQNLVFGEQTTGRLFDRFRRLDSGVYAKNREGDHQQNNLRRFYVIYFCFPVLFSGKSKSYSVCEESNDDPSAADPSGVQNLALVDGFLFFPNFHKLNQIFPNIINKNK
jgi:hypothetical protein